MEPSPEELEIGEELDSLEPPPGVFEPGEEPDSLESPPDGFELCDEPDSLESSPTKFELGEELGPLELGFEELEPFEDPELSVPEPVESSAEEELPDSFESDDDPEPNDELP